ncbi:MAG: hypothetical protein J5570_02925, partial [Lachnospiraceae bacterium]|nr:hypothetical protein [Lachnospiraceae bacterium]
TETTVVVADTAVDPATANVTDGNPVNTNQNNNTGKKGISLGLLVTLLVIAVALLGLIVIMNIHNLKKLRNTDEFENVVLSDDEYDEKK